MNSQNSALIIFVFVCILIHFLYIVEKKPAGSKANNMFSSAMAGNGSTNNTLSGQNDTSTEHHAGKL